MIVDKNPRGAGRKALPDDKKMVNKTMRVPPDMFEFINKVGNKKIREIIQDYMDNNP
jgi:hypothetical protein